MSEIWERITSWENVLHSYNQTLKSLPKHNAQCVEFRRNETFNLINLRDEILSGEYAPSPYHVFEIFDPKHRHIHAPQYRDKIVHHILYQVLRDVYEPKFIFDSYSCIRNKGNAKAVKRIQSFIRKLEMDGDVWVYKLDVSKFFPSLDREILKSQYSKHLSCKNTLNLCYTIIDGSPNEKGIPLGSVTSQLSANVYMNPLDQYMKRKVKCKYYVRYADDIFILSWSKESAKIMGDACRDYITGRLNLRCPCDKVYLCNVTRNGLDGLGYKIYSTHILLNSRAKIRVKRRVSKTLKDLSNGLITQDEADLVFSSWMGYAGLANTYNFRKTLSLEFPELASNMKLKGESNDPV